MMKIKISHLAQIKEAEFEDKKITILAGDNGTGKTLLLETITYIRTSYQDISEDLAEDLLDAFNKTINVSPVSPEKDLNKIFSRAFAENGKNPSFSHEIEKDLHLDLHLSNMEKINEYLKDKIKNKYGKLRDEVNRHILFTDNSDFTFELLDLPKLAEKQTFQINLFQIRSENIVILVKNGSTRVSRIIPREKFLIQNEIMDTIETYSDFVDQKKMYEIILKNIKILMIKSILTDYFDGREVLFLPSERNLMIDNALLKASAIDPDKLNIKQRYSERLFNSIYLKFKNLVESHPEILDRATKKIQKLFGGRLTYGDNGEITAIHMDNGQTIKRELFSTKQNRLIPYLIIHDPIRNYENVIIEEPESHLSLKSITELLEYLEELFKSDRSICITTHSDVFFSFLNNLLILNPDLPVNVYELKGNGNGENILENKERTEYGYEIDLFTSVLNDLYDQTLNIQQKNIE